MGLPSFHPAQCGRNCKRKKVSKVGELFIFRKKNKPQPEVEKKEEDENK